MLDSFTSFNHLIFSWRFAKNGQKSLTVTISQLLCLESNAQSCSYDYSTIELLGRNSIVISLSKKFAFASLTWFLNFSFWSHSLDKMSETLFNAEQVATQVY